MLLLDDQLHLALIAQRGQSPFLDLRNEKNAQLARQPDAKLRAALRAWPQLGGAAVDVKRPTDAAIEPKQMKPVVYIESTVISYLVSRPSRDVIVAGRQALTLEWWEHEKQRFDLRVSALVEDEIGRGDPAAAERRLALIEQIPRLAATDNALFLSEILISEKAIPAGSEDDALHIAIAATQGVDYLLTWNFKHINNAETKKLITRVVESLGYVCPLLCSPEELGGTSND
jgi:hypothetical protein